MQIGIDIGATKIEFIILNVLNKTVYRKRIPTPKSYKKILTEIKIEVLR